MNMSLMQGWSLTAVRARVTRAADTRSYASHFVNGVVMKVIWCWRCKMEVPMLDEKEFGVVATAVPPAEC